MSVQLPNGTITSLSTTLTAAVAVSDVTNADPAVASAVNSLSAGDVVLLTSGWSKFSDRAFRAASPSGTTFEVEGQDTTDTGVYPAGNGAGTFQQVTAWTSINQMLDIQKSGGEVQKVNYQFMEEKFERQLATIISAESFDFTLADDITQAGYQALVSASDAGSTLVLRMQFPKGGIALFAGTVTMNETPNLSQNELMSVNGSFDFSNRVVRYAS